eukprot:scaffold13392_cov19-Cyclotella_meneghiniana.AAC.1
MNESSLPPAATATQLAQMRQEIMDSIRAELRGEFQSRVEQLEDECSGLKQECKLLKQSQLKGEARLKRSLRTRANKLEN